MPDNKLAIFALVVVPLAVLGVLIAVAPYIAALLGVVLAWPVASWIAHHGAEDARPKTVYHDFR